MITLLIAAGAGVILVMGAALVLPCPACKKRRERLRAVYAEWKARKR